MRLTHFSSEEEHKNQHKSTFLPHIAFFILQERKTTRRLLEKGWKIGIALGGRGFGCGRTFSVLRAPGAGWKQNHLTTVQVTTGDLEKSVTEQGTVAMADSLEIKENFDVTITAWKTSTGQSVNEGTFWRLWIQKPLEYDHLFGKPALLPLEASSPAPQTATAPQRP